MLRLSSLNRKLLRDLVHMRGQVIAVSLVTACGIAAFISMRSIYLSLPVSLQAYYATHHFADVFVQVNRAPESLAASIREIPGISTLQTRVVANVTLDVRGVEEPARGHVVSVPDDAPPILNGLVITEGRYIQAGRRDEVIVSASFAKANNLHPGDTLPAVINGKWQRLQIVGTALSPEYVYEILGGELFPDNRRAAVLWMGRKALGAAFDMDGAFNDVSFSLAPGAHEAEVINRLDALLDKYGGLGAYGREDQTSHYFVTNEIKELSVTSTYLPGIFLGITAFLLHLVISRLVSTQRDQIAVLKAFGYGNFAIGFHFLKLSFSAILGGALLGVGAGWWFGYQMTALYAEFFRFPILEFTLGYEVIASALVISIVSSSLGAALAVYRAVSLPPAEAMRPEMPSGYRAGLMETLGLHQLLSPAMRIVVRNLARHPVKAALTTLGTSLSVALLVTGFYLYYDAVARVIDVMFEASDREDLYLGLNEPRGSAAKFAIANLPGVLRVETQRVVPARLRHGHHFRRMGLTGLESKATLRRVVDSNYKVFELPPDGIVLSTQLAKSLNISPGETLTVEVLEGERPTRDIVVAATVDDVVGLAAYMEINALNRLMMEGPTVSGFFVMADAKQMPVLFATLKNMPAIRSVIVPRAMLESFKETIVRTMNTSTAILVVFSCIIAFGVIYNGARIALSERGRELASLRVLGFTKSEVAVMLLGEQAILTTLAIPVGFGLGWSTSRLITWAVDNEMLRLPLVISGQTWARSGLIVAAAAVLSGLLVFRRLSRLDLIEVLKTRE